MDRKSQNCENFGNESEVVETENEDQTDEEK